MRLFGPPNPNPEYFDCIDHISGDIHDDSIENLRWLPIFQNNIWSQKTKGYCFHKASGKYETKIGTPVKKVSLGYYDTPEEAAAGEASPLAPQLLPAVGRAEEDGDGPESGADARGAHARGRTDKQQS